MDADGIINKVSQSGLITIDLEEFYPEGERASYDITQNLWQGMALKEKEFREFISNNNWEVYKDKFVALYCSADAIIPQWAYMLLTNALRPYAKKTVFGNPEVLETVLFHEAIDKLDMEKYRDARVVIKGCSKLPVPVSAYIELTQRLLPVVKSLMYGEACSTVPVYKKKQ
ncbi:MAG: DUF2480 family protein [Bacteroidota bacterium]